MRAKKEQIKRVHISPRKFYEYAIANGIDPGELHLVLSAEELEQFEIGPKKFPTGFLPLYNHYECFNCGKKTGWLDKHLGLFMCSEECRDAIDIRYNAGEDFEPHPKYVQLCEDHMKDFE
ncbi:MAG: hypothetical protein K0R18_83 [Bacillales bacterium]|jgi:hypothetical protein|nr:hypothetical protein [Bacillales bacterium]